MPKPALLLEIALDQRGLGNWAEAKKFYELYLGTQPTGPAKALAKKGFAEAREHVEAGDVVGAVALGSAPPPAPEAPPPVAPAPPPPELSAPLLEATPSVAVPRVEEPPPPASHVLAFTLAGVGVAAAAGAVVGWVEVASYNGYVGAITPGTPGAQALNRQSQASLWQGVAIGASIAAGLAAGAAVLAW